MSKARLVITAVEIERITPAEAASRYGVSKGWVSKLVARYRAEGDTALEPRSRAPKTDPIATADTVVELVLRLRKQLTDSGLDAGADTLDWHLRHRHGTELSRATINRILARGGAITQVGGHPVRSLCVRDAHGVHHNGRLADAWAHRPTTSRSFGPGGVGCHRHGTAPATRSASRSSRRTTRPSSP